MTEQDRPTVLIAEDEPSVAEGYVLWLSDRYDIRLAADGAEALEAVDESIDVVLLDRMMPELSGGQVLAEIRERGIDCRVVMVTAVEPDFDLIEMGFDAYVTKPPDRQELIDTIERLLDRAGLDDALQEYHSLMARKGALQAQKSDAELDDSDAYQDLLERIKAEREKTDQKLGDMGSDIDFVSAVREIAEERDTVEERDNGGDDQFKMEEDSP